MTSIELKLKNSNVGARFINSSFENYYNNCSINPTLQLESLVKARKYVSDAINNNPDEKSKDLVDFMSFAISNWMLITGITGTGKTHLAISILREILLNEGSGFYINYYEFEYRYNDLVLKKQMQDVDLLIIDSFLNYINPNPSVIDDELNDILTVRKGFNKPTIFINYLEENDMSQHLYNFFKLFPNPIYKDQFTDNNIILCNWESYRGKCIETSM